MFRGRTAAVAAALAIAAAAAATAGCGGGSSGSALSLDPVAAAATKSQQAGAARIRFALALSGPQMQGKTFRMRASGAIDGTSGQLTFNLGSLMRQMGVPQGASTGATTARLQHASIKEIFLQQDGHYVIYMRLGVLASQIPGGKQWLKLDLSKLGKSAGLDFGKLLSGSQLQPTDLLGMLRGEGAKIRKLGSATVNGRATTHYRVTVDVAKALQAKGLTSPLLGSIATQLPKLPEDVWIGKDGLVRRVAIAYSFAPAGRQLRMRMTMNLSHYGAHIKIAAPPSSDVFDATQLAQGSFGSSLFH